MNNKVNTIKVKITNVDISGPDPYKIELYLNDSLIEQLEYDDEYNLYNNKIIQIYSDKIGDYININ